MRNPYRKYSPEWERFKDEPKTKHNAKKVVSKEMRAAMLKQIYADADMLAELKWGRNYHE